MKVKVNKMNNLEYIREIKILNLQFFNVPVYIKKMMI